MENQKKGLENLKKEYSEIESKFKLPSFDEMNKEFCIEKISEYETDILIREVRRFVSEKFSNYLKFIEAILNPINSPLFVFSVIKSLSNSDRKKLSEIYKKFAKKEAELLELDLNFSEEKEAEFILDSYSLWKEIKKDLLEIAEIINKNWNRTTEIDEKGKGYFG